MYARGRQVCLQLPLRNIQQRAPSMTTSTTAATEQQFHDLLKSWRTQSGISQLELSMRSDVSQKHISFLESSKSRPSQSMVIQICEAMDIPLRDRNTLLLAAGFAPLYQRRDLTEPEISSVNLALDMMLDQQEPYPAVVVDSLFNVLRVNNGALKLNTALFKVDHPEQLPVIANNVLRGLFHPDGYQRCVSNWHELAPIILRRLQNEIDAGKGSPELQVLLSELESYKGVPKHWKQHKPEQWLAPIVTTPIVTIDIDTGTERLSLLSTISTLGTPQDVTLEELRIESYFPGNDATRKFFEAE
jgi:transcriptional regulator with XRE-family HTH domain